MNQDNRTLQPTTRRRQQARLEGNVAVSGQVTAAVVWLAVAVGFTFAGRHALASLKRLFTVMWATPDSADAAVLTNAVFLLIPILVPALLLILAAAWIGRLAQVGHVWAPRRVLPDASRIDPSRQLANLFSPGRLHLCLVAAGLSLAGFAFVGWAIWSQQDELLHTVAAADLENELLQRMSNWGLRLGMFLVAFAVVDYVFQRYRFELSLHMTPEELSAEIKAVEGNPQIASGRRDIRRQIRQADGGTSDG